MNLESYFSAYDHGHLYAVEDGVQDKGLTLVSLGLSSKDNVKVSYLYIVLDTFTLSFLSNIWAMCVDAPVQSSRRTIH